MFTISGTITAPAATLTHTDTSASGVVGSFESGTTAAARVGVLTNTGNVDQTVTAGNVTNLVNCELSSVTFLGPNGISTPSPIKLVPGESAPLLVTVTLPAEVAGTPDTAFSFDMAESTWS